jgi:penicillin-binding protein 1A
MFKKLLILIVFLSFSLVASLVSGYLVIEKQIPEINSVSDYSPSLPTKIYDRNGVLLRKLGTEEREIVAIDRVPKKVLNAFLAAEDSSFYEHSGVDLFGIARAFIANLKAGKVVQGGSTITQQVAKSFLDNKERSIIRKLKDIVLASKLEKKLTKDEILFLYLNQVYLGGGYYGIKAAFKGYFGKELSEVTHAEAAMVAGLLVAPSKYSPYRNPKYAYLRQGYVLKRLFENGMITKGEHDEAKEENIKYNIKHASKEISFHFEEKIRQELLKVFSMNEILRMGLEVVTTLDSRLQQKAQQAVDMGVVEIDKRQGFDREGVEKIPQESFESYIDKNFKKALKAESNFFSINKENFERDYENKFESKLIDNDSDSYKEALNIVQGHILKNRLNKGLVVEVNDEFAAINVSGVKGEIYLEKLNWAKSRLVDSKPQWRSSPDTIKEVLEVGMIVDVSVSELNNTLNFTLFQTPKVQGAVVAIDPNSNHVLAMVGGSTYINSHFNRALQSVRQPGSAFKPFVYAAGIKHGFTPGTLLIDSPESLNAGDHSIHWKPRNYDGKYLGPITLRTSLEKSRNVTTIKLAKKMGVKFLGKFLSELDFDIADKKDLSIVLGSRGLTLFSLVKKYSHFVTENVPEDAEYFISVKDSNGLDLSDKFLKKVSEPINQLELSNTSNERINNEIENEKKIGLSDQERYIIRNLLRGVIQNGTGRKAKSLSKLIGGKTGTTSDYIDAWFVGFSNNLVLGVWTGFDENTSMGYGESGGKAALPIWIDVMKSHLSLFGEEQDDEAPEGIVNVLINKETGKLAELSTSNPFLEAFVEGTEPGAEDVVEDENGVVTESVPEKIDDEDFLNL